MASKKFPPRSLKLDPQVPEPTFLQESPFGQEYTPFQGGICPSPRAPFFLLELSTVFGKIPSLNLKTRVNFQTWGYTGLLNIGGPQKVKKTAKK